MESDAVELVCREVVELVTDYLAGALSAADRARFDGHLLTCPPCTAYMAQMRTTQELAADIGSPGTAASDEVPQQLADLFRRWHKGKPEKP